MRARLAVTAVALVAFAASVDAAQVSVWTPAPSLLETLVYVPDAAVDAPILVVALHGFGADATDMGRMAPAFTANGCIYAAVQAPYAFDADGRLARDWMLNNRRDRELTARALPLSLQSVDAVVDDLVQRFSPARVYLLGFSQGGRMAYQLLAATGGGRFAGMVALGAGFDAATMQETATATAASPRLYIGHGTDDAGVPLTSATSARDFLRERRYEVTFESFAGGHEIPPSVARNVVAWILSGR